MSLDFCSPATALTDLIVGTLLLHLELQAGRGESMSGGQPSQPMPCRAQDIALIDARRGATMFRTVAVPTLGIVENMSFYVCPGCGDEAHIFGHGGAARTGQELNMELLGQVHLVSYPAGVFWDCCAP